MNKKMTESEKKDRKLSQLTRLVGKELNRLSRGGKIQQLK